MSLSESQRSIITATVPILAEHGVEVTKHFYDHLIGDNPSLRNIFSHSAQVTSHQARALAGSVYAYAANINDLTPILPVVERINQKHASLNIESWQYDLVGEYLLISMREVLGADVFTDEVRDAWLAAYQQLAGLMAKREEVIMTGQEKVEGGWRGWRQMRIIKKVRESIEVTSFYLEPVDGKTLPTFKPGQYIAVRLDVPELGFKQPRHYSLSDAPHFNGHTNGANHNGTDISNTFRISVKRDSGLDTLHPDAPQHPGYISNLLHDTVEVGDTIEVSHPAGDFFLDLDKSSQTPVVLLSAGVGLTPEMSMLRCLLQRGDKRSITWLHVAKNKGLDAFADDVKGITREYENVKSKIYHSSPTQDEQDGVDFDARGRLDISALSEVEKQQLLHIDENGTDYFICGPNQFMAAVAKGLKEFGVDEGRVHMELFTSGDVDA